MALTVRQVAYLAANIINASQKVISANEKLMNTVAHAEMLARTTGTPLDEVFGPDPTAIVREDRSAGQLIAAVKALAQMHALMNNLATTPVVGEPAVPGLHLDAIIAAV